MQLVLGLIADLSSDPDPIVTFLPNALEHLFGIIADSLSRSGGYSIPGDGCECIYWENFVFWFES